MKPEDLSRATGVDASTFDLSQEPVFLGRTIAPGFSLDAMERIVWSFEDPTVDLYGGGALLVDRERRYWYARVEEHGSRLRLLTHTLQVTGPHRREDLRAIVAGDAQHRPIEWARVCLELGLNMEADAAWAILFGLPAPWRPKLSAPEGFSVATLTSVAWRWTIAANDPDGFVYHGALVRDDLGWHWYARATREEVHVFGPADAARAFREGFVPAEDIAQNPGGFAKARRAAGIED